ncbi:multiple epidermal growth factor-like domains protein 6 [Drosophila ficusphila]|uniref:multiple epidermal growth factor-like domains protein 6 n=1 Tax=Drosophila ficusphila TaxID=30025 RepID=UPI001C89DAF8|nr:multiple epidermal growth factor-like domains protein 6 [Drosophila ficusphila]
MSYVCLVSKIDLGSKIGCFWDTKNEASRNSKQVFLKAELFTDPQVSNGFPSQSINVEQPQKTKIQMLHIWILMLLAGFPAATRSEDLLELSCSSDVQCAQFERGRCVDMACICTARGSGEKVACSPVEEKLTNIIGGPCPCPMPNAICFAKWDQCICSAGFVPSADRRRCLPEVVRMGGECEFQRQCQLADRFSSCSANQCLCRNHFELHEGRCLAVLQSSCREDKDCDGCGASICLTKTKKCGCAPNFVHNRNMTKCIPGAAYGESCEHSPPCKLNLEADGQCLDHICSCRPSHYPKRVANEVGKRDELDEDLDSQRERIICEPIVPFGALCRHDSECRNESLEADNVTEPAAMVCKWGECSCSETHRLEDNKCIFVESGAASNQAVGFVALLLLQFTMVLY